MALSDLARNAPEISEIVITGGPCAGKTSSLSYLSDRLRDYGFRVFIVPEVSTMLRLGGLYDLREIESSDPELYYQTQKEFVLLRRDLRQRFRSLARAFTQKGDKCVILHDRGEMDTSAYMTPSSWRRMLDELGLSIFDVRDSYETVIHMQSVAKDAPALYTLETNDARQEGSVEQAIAADEATLAAWVGHPKLRIIDNSGDFPTKLRCTLLALARGIGIPEPLEIERKFLLSSLPDLTRPELRAAQPVEIEQTYLLSSDPLRELRVRRRSQEGQSVYTRTEKLRLSSMTRQEKEAVISAAEYEQLLASRDPDRHSIRKIRYCFPWGASYFELDVFDEPAGLALLEVELTQEEDEITLPPFLEIEREVTGEPEWANANLAALS